MMDNTIFLYSGGRIRSLEKGLLTRDTFERMAEADSEYSVHKILSETGYGDESLNFCSPYDYERVLGEETSRLYRLMYEICPVREAVDLFGLKYDYHNIKLLLKARYLEKDIDYLLYDIGTIPVAKIKEYISGEEFSKLSPYMSWGIRECLHRFELKEDPQIIDVVMDHALYGEINGILEKIQFPYLSNMISTMIDLTNIRILIRVKAQNRNRDFLESILIKGGSLKPELFISSLNESLDNFPDKIRHTGYSEAIRDGISKLLNTGSLTQLEKVVDDIIMKRVKDGKFISLGIEPVIGYLLAKETEIKNIRIVMVGKINHVSPQVIMERLRDTYV